MKRWFVLLLLMLSLQICRAQKAETHHLEYAAERLNKVLLDTERHFNIKYSYADSIIEAKILTLPAKEYSLEELHSEINTQTFLEVIKIDGGYYSIHTVDGFIKAEQLQEILVEGFLSKGINKTNGRVIISPQKIEALPGVTDADILLSLQQLPGVKSPNETASGLYVRGGTSDQNLILWDGIRMYHPGHLFGMISGFNPNVEQTVHFYNKATNSKFGERISSVIDIRPTDKIQDSLKIDAGINALNADLYVRAPLIKKKLGLQLSGRKSYTELWQSPTFDALADKVFQNSDFRSFNNKNQFGFEDYAAKLNFKAGLKSEISLTGLLIDNDLNFNTTANTSSVNQQMDIKNYGYSINYRQQYSSKLRQKMLIYYSAYTFDFKKTTLNSVNDFQAFEKRNRVTDSGVELNFDYTANTNLNIEFGYHLLGNDISHSFTSKTDNIEINLDTNRLYNISQVGYFHAGYVLEKWDFQSGVRYNYYNKLKADSFEPRIFIQRKLANTLFAQLSFERKSQIMSQVRESVSNDQSLENYVWILSDNRSYPVQKGNQFTAGMIYKASSWLIDADAYYKTIDGITSLTFGFVHRFDSEIHMGKGFTKGIDLLVQKSAPAWRAWVTYTYQDSQNKYEGLNNNRYFPVNSGNKHSVNVAFTKKWNDFTAALGWFWHTGKPYSILENNHITAFNTARLPEYHRLDVSATYRFQQNKSWTGKIGLSILNAYNRRIVISKEYERQYAEANDLFNTNYTIRDYHSLGITPNVFVRVSF